MMPHAFASVGLPDVPVMLAPLAGVSDAPMRLACYRQGADLCYVEMLSATALLYGNQKTFAMAERHPDEPRLGVQLTGRSAEEVARAVGVLDQGPYETIDINMGCPVRKIVKTGCGSAILQDPQRVYDTIRLSREETDKPVSAKIRIGWDHEHLNFMEVADAVEKAGASWIVVHGRTRSDDYSVPVSLDAIAAIKQEVSIPVIGNGNLFSWQDAETMHERTGVDGWMVSRGALGNPWIFADIKNQSSSRVSLDAWVEVVMRHLQDHIDLYGESNKAAVCMRKHMQWYTKGWPNSGLLRSNTNSANTCEQMKDLILEFSNQLRESEIGCRNLHIEVAEARFSWDPKFDMDRKLDRGVASV